MVRNENDAWDLAQEGFLQAWRSNHKFEGRSSFYTWLYRLTVNLAIDSLRRKGRRAGVELDDAIPSSLPSPRANYRRTEISEHINAALALLTPEHRAVIVLKEIEDLQYYEIAEILGISVGTVMSRLFYGRKKLQSILRPIYNQITNLNVRELTNRSADLQLRRNPVLATHRKTRGYGTDSNGSSAKLGGIIAGEPNEFVRENPHPDAGHSAGRASRFLVIR